ELRELRVLCGTYLQVAAEGLLALNGLEERLEVAGAEAASALALDHLEEDRWAVLHVLGKDLEQVAIVVTVHEDAEPCQLVYWLINLADARLQFLIVGRWRREEFYALRLELSHCRQDVAGDHSNVLHARAAIVVQILLDLRSALLLALSRLVDGEL